MRNLLINAECKMMVMGQKVKEAVFCRKGENYVDVGVFS